METRQVHSRFRSESGLLTGIIPYDSPTQIRSGAKSFTEVVRPGAFARSLAATTDVLCCFNHDPNRLLGRTSSGTLSLEDSSEGLKFSVRLPDSESALRELVSRGDVTGASFTFSVRPNGDSWKDNKRELRDLELVELGPVVMPCYQASTVAMRSMLRTKYKLELYERLK